jgi:hypothetical protein
MNIEDVNTYRAKKSPAKFYVKEAYVEIFEENSEREYFFKIGSEKIDKPVGTFKTIADVEKLIREKYGFFNNEYVYRYINFGYDNNELNFEFLSIDKDKKKIISNYDLDLMENKVKIGYVISYHFKLEATQGGLIEEELYRYWERFYRKK